MLNVMAGQSPRGGEDDVRAEQSLSDVLRMNGDAARVHIMLGARRPHQGRYQDSLFELQVANELSPNHPWTLTNLGITMTFLGQPGKVLPLIKKSPRLFSRDYFSSISYTALGLCHLLLDHPDKAFISLKTARAINPRMAHLHWWLAAALALKSELEGGKAALRLALEMNPLLLHLHVPLKHLDPAFIAHYGRTASMDLRRAGLRNFSSG